MDWMEFVSSLVKSVAWPLAVVVVAILFREQVVELLRRVKRGKIGSAELEFESAMANAAEGQAEGGGTPGDYAASNYMLSDPRSAVLDAWLRVEHAAQNLAEKVTSLSRQSLRNPRLTIRAIAKAEAINGYHISILDELRYLRNQAAHEVDFNPSRDAVARYVELAQEVENALIEASNQR